LKPKDRIELRIERLAHGGSGVGRFEGMVVFVPLSAPGDTVLAELTEVKKNFAAANLIEVKSPGPTRRLAPCPYYGKCGGCSWQHVEYAEQLNQKNQMVAHLVSKKWPEAQIDPVVSSANEWRYRRRVQIHAESGRAGFLKRASHEIVDIEDCLITEEKVAAKLPEIKALARGSRKKFELVRQDNAKIKIIDLERDPYAFMQVNEEQNRNLIASVIARVETAKPNEIFDLYCGSGNFSIPLARYFPKIKVTGVESNSESSARGRDLGTHLENLEILTTDTVRFLKRRLDSMRNAVVVMDPPRAGAEPEVIELLKELEPKSIVYVSCHPATASRDWSSLAPSYSVLHITPFDMFPQTDHIELIATLSDPARLD
jgi:23S rRNA (uracil1939-C5)-methyltransferase